MNERKARSPAAGRPPYRISVSSMSVSTRARRQSLANTTATNTCESAKAHHSQLPATPSLATRPAT